MVALEYPQRFIRVTYIGSEPLLSLMATPYNRYRCNIFGLAYDRGNNILHGVDRESILPD